MSWLCRNPEILDGDLDVLEFEREESRILTIERQDNDPDFTDFRVMTTCDDWREWLEQDHLKRRHSHSSRINLILGGREQTPWGHNPSAVATLPWTSEIFCKIKKCFFVHSAIIRTINRNTSCMFSQMRFDWNLEGSREETFVYNCRTAASWPGDMAMSVTFCPSSLTTNAILFGCDMRKPDMYDETMTLADIIKSRLENSDTRVFHPMLLPTLFADIERDRQIELVREKLGQLSQRMDHLTLNESGHLEPHHVSQTRVAMLVRRENSREDKKSIFSMLRRYTWDKQQREPTSPGLSDEKGSPELGVSRPSPVGAELPTAKLWQEISRLKIGLSNWQRQLLKMISHVEELNRTEFSPPLSAADNQRYEEHQRLQFLETGTRISERLRELVDEYDEYIRECTHIMDGFSLATQLEISHIGRSDAMTNQEISQVNLDVARMSRRDSSIMKSIAVLGMIFLPASFATAFFSMDFFDLSKEGNSSAVSKLFWIYVLAAVTLTLATMGLFYCCILKRQKSNDVRNTGSSIDSLA